MTDSLLAASDQNLVWIDLEMTGLFPDTDRIIELAVVVTDPQLTVRIEGPVFAVHQSDATLDAIDPWNKGTRGKRWKPEMLPFRKLQAHTALADINESIDELLHYREHLLAK